MNKQKVFGLTFSTLALSMSASTLNAAELDILITNATKGIYFTPILVAALDSSLFMFRTGETASAELLEFQARVRNVIRRISHENLPAQPTSQQQHTMSFGPLVIKCYCSPFCSFTFA